MILVVGGGITGLSFACSTNDNVCIVEKSDELGGYCRTTIRNDYVWDRAGHFFHFKNKKLKDFFLSQFSPGALVEVNKKTAIFFEEYGLVDFPFQKNIHQLPLDVYIKCLVDLYEATHESQDEELNTFIDFCYSSLGRQITEMFLKPYNEKLYACDLNLLDRDAMGRFFPHASFKDILINPLEKSSDSYNESFQYPKNGAQSFVKCLESNLGDNVNVKLNCEVVSIDIDKMSADLSDGSIVHFDCLINTAPLPNLLAMCGLEIPSSFTFNKVLVFNLGFDSSCDDGHHWLYYPGKEVFYRVGCYHNIYKKNKASFYVEIGVESNGFVTDTSVLLHKVLSDLSSVGLINDEMTLVDYEYLEMNPAYVHVNKKSDMDKEDLLKKLRDKQIYSSGRYGDWKYCSIEDNLLEAARLSWDLANTKSNKNSFRDIYELGTEISLV
jgi:protoporphyrinogen oxidase